LGAPAISRIVGGMKLIPNCIRFFLLLLFIVAATGSVVQAKPKAKSKPKAKVELETVAAPEPGVRDITMRHIDHKKDRKAAKRIHYFKARLPVEVRDRNNFAWAKADIRGLPKKEYYAHSRVQSLSNYSSRVRRRISGISPKPPQETAQFETLFVDFKGNIGGPNAIPRYYDTEYKIIEDIAARLTNTATAGSIQLYTDLIPCRSCRGVMRQFLAIYTNIEIEVLYDWP